MVVTKVFIRCLIVLAVFVSPLAQADALSEIVERGTLRVGISEFVPWAMPVVWKMPKQRSVRQRPTPQSGSQINAVHPHLAGQGSVRQSGEGGQ